METKLLRLVGVNSDQSKVPGATRTVPLVHPDTGRPLEGVTAVVRMMSPDRYRELEKEHRQPKKGAGGKVEWEVDFDALKLAVLVESVESWAGVIGADHKPVPVTAAVLQELDPFNQVLLAGIARSPAELVDAEVVAASFRQPADVAGVAG